MFIGVNITQEKCGRINVSHKNGFFSTITLNSEMAMGGATSSPEVKEQQSGYSEGAAQLVCHH